MDAIVRTNLDNLWAAGRQVQNESFSYILDVTNQPVGWAYEAWDEMIANLGDKDNHNRAIAAQVLCNLAKSDPAYRMAGDFSALLAVTKDERFVTARHCMQALWKVGVVGKKQQKLVIDGLTQRFKECRAEKNCTLIRYDIIQSLKNMYDVVADEKIRQKALELIESEEDLKYRKKYASLWKSEKRK